MQFINRLVGTKRRKPLSKMLKQERIEEIKVSQKYLIHTHGQLLWENKSDHKSGGKWVKWTTCLYGGHSVSLHLRFGHNAERETLSV